MNLMVDRIATIIRAGFALDATAERIARCVIEDMRLPTKHMVHIGEYNLEACKGDGCEKAALHTYRTMIDAALEETSGQPKETARGT